MVEELVEAGSRRAARGTSEDRFDHVPRNGRIGAHRVTSRPRHFWSYFLIALLGFAALTTLGILWVQGVGSITENPLAQRTETTATTPPPTQAEIDPEATVIVLDGTPDGITGAAVDQTITQEKWGTILFSGAASSSDIAESVVYYAVESDESAALGLAEQLGGLPVMHTDKFSDLEASLVVVIGADYEGPGADAAAEAVAGVISSEETAVQ